MRPSLYTIAFALVCFFSVDAVDAASTLRVPFTPQAPEGNWSQPWQDACEEAVIHMVDQFYAGRTLGERIAAPQAAADLRRIFRIKNSKLGWSLDEDAEKMTQLINDFFPWEARIVANPSIADLKAEIDANRPVIIPAAGRLLYNPHFQDGGPPYHTVVLSGYDDLTRQFITQEPGTRYGHNYRYSYDTIMNAMHDFVPGNVPAGRKVALFTRATPETSAHTDGDGDGLTKSEELTYGTVLWLADSDGDGYTDGEEVEHGYNPTKNEVTLAQNGTLIKGKLSTKVYLVQDNKKRHILNEDVFLSHGWQWQDIIELSDAFVDRHLPSGESIAT